MGACFDCRTFEAPTPNAARKIVADMIDQSRFEDGHSYSGQIGMANGIKFPRNVLNAFPSARDAEDWLEDRCEKWGPALVVPFKDESGSLRWMAGALCSS